MPKTEAKRKIDKMRAALRDFTGAIEATGGVTASPEDEGYTVPVADEDWIDLGEAYLKACEALGKKPKTAARGGSWS